MNVAIAECAGFCFGVERAFMMVHDARNNHKNVITFGPIIHNPQVVAELEKSGVFVKNSLDQVTNEMTAVIRAHGMEKDKMEELKARSKLVLDATCPFVKKVQIATEILSNKGLPIVVVGEKNHPEVQGILSYISGEHFVVADVEQAMAIEYRPAYGVVAQTTQNEMLFNAVVDVLKTKCDTIDVSHTICNATHVRQKAALKLAKDVDVMFIVGGRNSANTTRLYSLCKTVCPKTYHIETANELDLDMLKNAENIGISAGASTPNEIINKVQAYILENGA